LRSTTAGFAFCLSLALGIAVAPAAAKEATKTSKDADAEQPFIAETRIVAPRRVGDFALEQTRYDDKTKYAGVALRYAHADHPEIRIDLFVYPAGDIPVERALKTELKDFRESLQSGVKLGYFSDLRELGVDDFEIRPEPTAETGDAPQAGTPAADNASAPDATAPLPGKRLRLHYMFVDPESGERHPMRSRGYLAYRQLYYFKARITAAESQVDEDTFSAVADRAMRTLTLAVQAYNIGACAEKSFVLGPMPAKDAVDLDDALLKALLGDPDTPNTDNCRARLDPEEWAKVSADAFVETITFTAEDWGGTP
jgi:hypothetical protein